MSGWQEFTGLNRGYVLELYEKYRENPSSVDDETRALFERWTPPAQDELPTAAAGAIPLEKVVGAVNLAESIRRYGHLAARLDPLGGRPPIGDPSLLAATHGVTDEDLRSIPANLVAGPLDGVTTALRRDRGAPPHLLFDDRLRLRARVRARRARMAAAGGGAGTVPRAGRSDRSCRAARPAVSGRGVRAFSAADVPWQDALLDRRARHARARPRRGDRRVRRGRHRANPDRHGAPRPAERHGARAEQAVRADSGRVQGSRLAQFPRGHGVDGRRQVPRRRAPRDQGRCGDGSRRLDAAQPEPSRGGRPDRRRHGARGGHERGRPGCAEIRSRTQRADPDPRRRGVPWSGRRRRNAQPEPAARLLDRRDDPHHRQQPARLHDRSGRRLQHVVRERAGARASRSRSST